MATVETTPKRAKADATAGGDAPAGQYPTGTSVGYLVRETHRAFTRSLQARIAPHGVNIGMWFFLRVLWEEDGLSQRELSQRVRMMEPTTVTALRNMEKRGIVRRERNRTDRRVINVFLTDHGRDLRERLLPLAMEVNAVAASGIAAPELDLLRAILGKLRINLDKDAGAATTQNEVTT